MTDEQIVDLYRARDESAVSETADKYGGILRAVAKNILRNDRDAEECVNDTYLKAWESMPDARPTRLCPYLAQITRNLALNRLRERTAEKRGGGRPLASLDELSECVSGEAAEPGGFADRVAFKEMINGFLAGLKPETRGVFVARYWYSYSISEIARMYGISESKTAVTLFRTREKLKKLLETEGLF